MRFIGLAIDRDNLAAAPPASRPAAFRLGCGMSSKYDEGSPRPLSGDERMRIRFAAANLAAKIERMQGKVPPDTARNAAAKWIGDLVINEKNRPPPRR
jgi:hypothetical protein